THPGIDATRLSAVIAFDRSTLGNVIERLETKRLIERKPSGEDKRVKLLYLTKSGAMLLRDIIPPVDRAQGRMLPPWTPPDRRTRGALPRPPVAPNNEASGVPLRAEDALEHLEKSNWGAPTGLIERGLSVCTDVPPPPKRGGGGGGGHLISCSER